MTGIFFFILILTVAIMFRVVLKTAKNKVVYFYGKITNFVLVFYIVLLLIATVLYIGITNDREMVSERISAEEITKAMNAQMNFYHYIESGKLSETDGVFINKEWHFPIPDNRLIVSSTRMDGNDDWIVVEKKKETDDDKKVHIIQYMTKSIIDDYDYSHHIQPPNIKVNQQGIQINHPAQTELKFTKFTKEFTINQFTSPQYTDEHIFSSINHISGQHVLYMQVPESVEIVEGKGVYLQFID
ncbi:hypothetical protein [Calidifontibacillus erzurumensis]|uniref:hypothetical protein n=1 Tax=Calidifontibacillus erzurumensis TaxID=2741433 RepID=UPI0035B5301C